MIIISCRFVAVRRNWTSVPQKKEESFEKVFRCEAFQNTDSRTEAERPTQNTNGKWALGMLFFQ